MFWEEKIDRLKKETDPTDFKVPFTEWSTILKKIEDKFVIKENSDSTLSNWDSRLKRKTQIKKILTANIDIELEAFDPKQNYWIVLTRDKADFKNLVYDSKLTVIKILSELWDGDFYIVDKKYSWLTYFKRDNTDTEVFKSGDFVTPLDKKLLPSTKCIIHVADKEDIFFRSAPRHIHKHWAANEITWDTDD